MNVFGLPAGFARLAKYSTNHTEVLSEKAQFKWQVLDLLHRSQNMALVCDHYQISRATLYRWKAQFKPRSAASLEEQSRRPKRVRTARYSRELETRVIELRKQYGWGKDKLVVLLKREDLHTSASTVGRILARSLEGKRKMTPDIDDGFLNPAMGTIAQCTQFGPSREDIGSR